MLNSVRNPGIHQIKALDKMGRQNRYNFQKVYYNAHPGKTLDKQEWSVAYAIFCSPDDGRKRESRLFFSGEARLDHARPVVDDQGFALVALGHDADDSGVIALVSHFMYPSICKWGFKIEALHVC